VFVVDAHEVTRLGLECLLAPVADLQLVGTGSTAEDAVRAVTQERADIVVIDADLEGDGGRQLAQRLAGVRSRTRYCFLISGNDTAAAAELSRFGASGLLHKRASGRHLVEGLRRLAQGSLVVDPVMAELLMATLLDPRPCRDHEELTERDLELLRLLGEGRTNREIAQAVFLSEKTVKNYLSRLFRKLGVRSRTEAALLSSRLAGSRAAGRSAL
jgi:DNA-binding NarL/FixJ family response regulator